LKPPDPTLAGTETEACAATANARCTPRRVKGRLVSKLVAPAKKDGCHCEKRRDEAIHARGKRHRPWIASLRSQ